MSVRAGFSEFDVTAGWKNTSFIFRSKHIYISQWCNTETCQLFCEQTVRDQLPSGENCKWHVLTSIGIDDTGYSIFVQTFFWKL